MKNSTELAVFAAGCFWGVQDYFDQVEGVLGTSVGYTGGHSVNPSYEDVCRGDTNHAEALKIEFDSKIVSYQDLLKHFFRMHDATQYMRQGPDVGSQYRSAIFFTSDEQKALATEAKNDHQTDINAKVVTEINVFDKFFEAEEYHQKYTAKTGRGGCHIPLSPLPKN